MIPPEPSDTRISSPGATRKWFFRGSQAPVEASVRQALPGVLEKLEMVPSTPTEPTTSRVGFLAKFQLTSAGWATPSLPAATTRIEYLALPEARAPFQPGLRVQPASPSEALITPRLDPAGAILVTPPRVTSSVSHSPPRPREPNRPPTGFSRSLTGAALPSPLRK